MTTPTLKLSGAYPHRQLDDLCRDLGPVLSDRSGSPPRLDMTELTALAPTNLALLLASITERYPRPGPSSVLVPTAEALAFLQGEKLEDLLADEAGRWEEGPAGLLLGALVFSAQTDVYRFLGELARLMGNRAGLDGVAQRAVYFLLDELITNAVRYSGVLRGAVVVELDLNARRLTLAVADCGIGVRRSLSRNPAIQVPDDLSALSRAVEPLQTGDPIYGAGMGLAQARWMVEGNRGAFLLRSGDARYERTTRTVSGGGLPELRGTVVATRLDCDGPLDYGKVDDALRQPQGIGNAIDR